MTTLAIIGAGSVGRALGFGLAASGHAVSFGVRDPGDHRHTELAPGSKGEAGAPVEVTTPAEATAGADVVVLAVPASAVADVVPRLGLQAGQIVVDATNAVGRPVPEGMSTMSELVASLAPDGVAVVKAFNTIGAEHLGDGRFDQQRAFLPIAGPEEETAVVSALAADLGFEPVVLGGAEAVRLVEDHARLWIHLAFNCGWGRSFGFVAVGK